MLTVGSQIQGYTIFKRLGGPEQSPCFMALDHRSQPVAIKVLDFLPAQGTELDKSVATFRAPFNVLQGIDHAAVPKAIELLEQEIDDEPRELPVQSFVKGRTLDDWLEEDRPFVEKFTLRIFASLLETLEMFHNNEFGLAHGSLHLSSIVLTENGIPVLLDLHRCTLLDAGHGSLTESSVDHLAYISKEQERTGCATPASDVYALGVVMATLVTGKRPSALELKEGKLHFEEFAKASPALKETISAMLEPIASDRLQTMSEVRDHLVGPADEEENIDEVAEQDLDGANPSTANNRIGIPQDSGSSMPMFLGLVIVLAALTFAIYKLAA